MTWLAPCALFLASFVTYLYSIHPTVSVGDSGEFITAAVTLGIPHPPAFPGYVLLSKLWTLVMPWGNPGYQVNLFSAFCAALAVALLFLWWRKLGISTMASVAGSLLIAFAVDWRMIAQASEVFALHALFIVLILLATSQERWHLVAFLAGCAATNHQTVIFIIPAVVMSMLQTKKPSEIPWLSLTLAGLGGLTLYAFLYFRAGQEPFFNIGDPDSLERLWRVVRRANYGSLTLALGDAPPRNLLFTAKQVARSFHGIAENLHWVGLAVGTFGLWTWWKRSRSQAWLIAFGFLFFGPIFLLIGNLPFDAQSVGILGRFHVVPLLFWSALIVGAIDWFSQQSKAIGLGLSAVLVFVSTYLGAGTSRWDLTAYSYGRNNLRSLPKDALFVMDGGDDTFYSLAYLTQVEMRRPDIELHDRLDVVFKGLYGDDFRGLSKEEKEGRRRQVDILLAGGPRPLLYSTMNEFILEPLVLQKRGLPYAVPKPSVAAPPSNSFWQVYDLRGVPPWVGLKDPPKDYRLRALLPIYAYHRATDLAEKEGSPQALQFASISAQTGPDVLWLLANLSTVVHNWAYVSVTKGKNVFAKACYEHLIHWNKRDMAAWLNRGALAERERKFDDAIASYRQAIAIDPKSAQAHFNLAVAHWHLSEWDAVIAELQEVIRLEPGYPKAAEYLAQAQRRQTS